MKAEDWIPVDVTKKDGLPKVGESALWRSQNGGVFQFVLDRDYGDESLKKFLEGDINTGRITHWQRIVQPKSSLSELNKVELEIEFRGKNEIKFNLIYIDTGEIRYKRVTGSWLMNKVFQSELKTWEKNGEGKVEMKKYSYKICKVKGMLV